MPYDRLARRHRLPVPVDPRRGPAPPSPGVQGLYDLADLDRMEREHARRVDRAVVVGGGLIGVELSEMLRTRGVAVTFLVRDDRYLPRVFSEGESALVAAAIRATRR